jgi:hypothetical protein
MVGHDHPGVEVVEVTGRVTVLEGGGEHVGNTGIA